MSKIPEGLCQCGCGNVTKLVTHTSTKRGVFRGSYRKFCKGHHARTSFESKFEARSLDECWLWVAGCFGSGYPAVRVGDGQKQAHRHMFEVVNDVILPDEIYVRHMCDNPQCVNPTHLEIGEAADNSRDMVERGRSLIGERNHKARLTASDVIEIRAKYGSGERMMDLARAWNVNSGTISHIVNRVNWRHLV